MYRDLTGRFFSTNRSGHPENIEGVARFFLGTIHKNGEKHTKLPRITQVKNVPNGHKIYQHFSFQALQKRIFLVRKYMHHLATLIT
jgi:hypothetical protein